MRKRIICLLLALMLVLPLLLQRSATEASAAKKEPTRAISIVLDNSGSMYMYENTAWCRATYAIEVFAAMMNEGDTLRIYPMHNITEGKPSGTIDLYSPTPGSTEPWVINGPKDAQRIRELYTPIASGTPFTPVEDAYRDLRQIQADEKFLIVLTDGAFDNEPSGKEISRQLDNYTRDMNVLFLGIGIGDSYKPTVTDPNKQYYAFPDSSEEVLTELTNMCNLIFGRNDLPSKFFTGDKIKFDLSVNKLIVFIQGENIGNIKVDGQSGTSTVSTHYSEAGGAFLWSGNEDGRTPATVDDSLQGMMATFDRAYDAGEYTLSYTGNATNVNVYYEPDVSLQLQFTDANGKTVDPQDCYAGEYTLSWCMVDNKTGEPTNSELLGEVIYDIRPTVNGRPIPATGNSVKLVLNSGDKVSGTFTVTYLKNYTDSSTPADLGWGPEGLVIAEQPMAAELVADQEYYVVSQLQEALPVYLRLTSKGGFLSGEEFDALEVQVKIPGLTEGKHYTIEPERDNSRYVIRFTPGSSISTKEYTIEAQVTGKDTAGKTFHLSASQVVSFNTIPRWVKIAAWFLSIGLVIFLIWAYMNMKVLPKDIKVGPCTFNVGGDRVTGDARCVFSGRGKKRGTLEVYSPNCMSNPTAKCGFILELEAVSPRSTKSGSRRAKVVGISAMNTYSTTSLMVGTCRMSKDHTTGKLVKLGGKPGAPIEFNIGNNCPTKVTALVMDMMDGSEVSCTLNVPLKFY